MWIGEINIEPLLKAFTKFENFRKNDKTEQEKAGIIQAFEYCFEISWKIMKRLLEERGKIANSPRETFRMAALEGFINDPEIWFEFLKKRNITVHTYNQEEASEVLSVSASFSLEVKSLLKNIGISYDEYRK
jgi:nucleotidyltransferase substrate binding protein (TIGR01987 family)